MISIFIHSLTLFLLTQISTPILKEAAPPVPPLNSPFTGLVSMLVEPDGNGVTVSPLVGAAPFLDASVDAVKKWKFTRPTPVSVTFLYRARQIFSAAGFPTELPEPQPAENRPPVLQVFVDPAYPATSIAEDVVMLELRISATGATERITVLRDVASLTDVAIKAVQDWKFSPALSGGKPVEGIAIVGISFLRPIVLP
jgi:hypothetical protein